MKKCVQHTINRTGITAYDQFIFILINLRKSYQNYKGTHYLENGRYVSIFKVWENSNGLTNPVNQWVVGSILDRILLSLQIQRELNPNIRGINETLIVQAIYFFLTVKKTLSNSMEPVYYNKLLDNFLEIYLTKEEPHYARHIHNRKKVINQLLKLNKNGVLKFKILKQGDTVSGKYVPGGPLLRSEVLILWFEVQIQFALFLIRNMEQYIDPNYLYNLNESYKTRRNYPKIKANFFFYNEECP